MENAPTFFPQRIFICLMVWEAITHSSKYRGLNGGVCGTEQVEDAARQSFFFFLPLINLACLALNCG